MNIDKVCPGSGRKPEVTRKSPVVGEELELLLVCSYCWAVVPLNTIKPVGLVAKLHHLPTNQKESYSS